MGNFLQVLPLLLKLKDVTSIMGENKFYYSKRFWGAIVTLLIGIAGYFALDLSLLNMTADQLTDNLTTLAEQVGVLVGGLYGIVMAVKGMFDARKRKLAGTTETQGIRG